MSTIAIPAREVKAGDVIDFGGEPLAVEKTEESHGHSDFYIYLPRGGMWVAADQPLTVTRPDPDAELIDVMARAAMIAGRWVPEWDDIDEDGRELARVEIRAALAAAREAGLL